MAYQRCRGAAAGFSCLAALIKTKTIKEVATWLIAEYPTQGAYRAITMLAEIKIPMSKKFLLTLTLRVHSQNSCGTKNWCA